VLIIQADSFNRSTIRTVIVAVITSNLLLADAPGNVFLPAEMSGLPKDSVVNVSQILTLDKSFLTEAAGRISGTSRAQVDAGVALILGLS
jgi:mRNA interferase MazF